MWWEELTVGAAGLVVVDTVVGVVVDAQGERARGAALRRQTAQPARAVEGGGAAGEGRLQLAAAQAVLQTLRAQRPFHRRQLHEPVDVEVELVRRLARRRPRLWTVLKLAHFSMSIADTFCPFSDTS